MTGNDETKLTRHYHWYWNRVIVETEHCSMEVHPRGREVRFWSSYVEASLLPLYLFLMVGVIVLLEVL